ncbi:MAG: hypothetical protein ABSE69_01355 [Roseiarcus sp.]
MAKNHQAELITRKPYQRNIRPADAGRRELGNDNKFVCRNLGQQRFEETLKRRRESLLKIGRPSPTQLAHVARIFNDCFRCHRATLAEIPEITTNGSI